MIGTALSFCLLFTVRAVWVGDHLLGAFFTAVTMGLGLYFRWFLKVKAEKTLGADTQTGGDH